jgi:cullin 3
VYTKTNHVPEIRDAGLHLFLKRIIRPPIQDHLIKAILNQIQFERDGYGINRSPVKGCVDVFLELEVDDGTGVTVYKRDLEPAVLRESEAFYRAEGQKLLEFCDAPEFLRRVGDLLLSFIFLNLSQVEKRLESEDLRTHHYLSRHTAIPLRRILKDNLLTPHLSTVISLPNSGLDTMIDTDKMDDIGRLYRLFTMVPTGLLCLKRSLKDSITHRGREINRLSLGIDGGDVDIEGDEADHVDRKGKGKARAPNAGAQTLSLALRWVQDVLDLKDKFDCIWKQACCSDREVESALNEVGRASCTMENMSAHIFDFFTGLRVVC